MDHKSKYLVFLTKLFVLRLVTADIYSVKIGTEQHVNVVDSRFLSFTVDPKYLFTSDEKYNSKESVCMASSLTPAYIRIAGPSTAHMQFRNTTITFTDLGGTGSRNSRDSEQGLEVTHRQWKNFVQWAKKTGFDLVFAINNEEKTDTGLWDPNPALNILSVADKANVSEIFWQLGYECSNQTIEEYLNDLETLCLIVETFPRDGWRVVGGDVTRCLRADSKSDFKDYVILSDEMLDAVLLNGNSSAQELERMTETDRLKLLRRLSQSTTPLWLTESPQHFQQFIETPKLTARSHKSIFHADKPRLSERFHRHTEKARRFGDKSRFSDKSHRFNDMSQRLTEQSQLTEMYRAADWMTSLGYSAKNGFAVHFRELIEDELYEPTLSFYMALLFKNLVGERVLPVDMEASEAIMFAHCTSLKHRAVPGAVTLFAANLDDEPARFSVKLSRREEGGDIMQFILGHDLNGNIIVNGRALYYEGDIRPVVKRVRPYKTLLLTLPPKSFGFWVLANTKVEACHYEDKKNIQEFIEAISASDEGNSEASNTVKAKRSMLPNEFKLYDEVLYEKDAVLKTNSEELKKTIESLNNDLKNVHEIFRAKTDKTDQKSRVKRQAFDQENENVKRKLRKLSFKHKFDRNEDSEEESRPKLNIMRKLLSMHPKFNGTRLNRLEKVRKLNRLNKNKVTKRHLKAKVKPIDDSAEDYVIDTDNKLKRKRRSVSEEIKNKPNKKITIDSIENEVDSDILKNKKLWKILHEIHEQIKDLPTDDENVEYTDYSSNGDEYKDEDHITVKTKMSDDGTTIKYSEKSKRGLLKSTVGNVVSVLGDLNNNLNRFWDALTLFD